MDNGSPELESQYSNLDLSNKEFGPESEEAEILKSTISSLMTEASNRYSDFEEDLEKIQLKGFLEKVIEESEKICIFKYKVDKKDGSYFIRGDITPRETGKEDEYINHTLVTSMDEKNMYLSVISKYRENGDPKQEERHIFYNPWEVGARFEDKRFY